MFSETDVEKAVHFIRDNAELVGQLRGQKLYLEHRMKVVRSQAFLDSKEKTVEARKADADTHPELETLAIELRGVEDEMAAVYTRIKAAELKTEVWRSQNANNRRGHV